MKGRILIYTILSAFFFASCEEEIDVDFPAAEPVVTVEGYVEPGEIPYVILTKSLGFFAAIDSTTFQGAAINGADVFISDGKDTVKMFQPEPTFPFYLAPTMAVAEGKTYTLFSTIEGQKVSASTTILEKIAVDSFYAEEEVITEEDTFYRLFVKFSEPNPVGNKYRYFTRRPSDQFFDTEQNSVFDDNFINGTTLDLPLNGSEWPDSTDFRTFGTFREGDTVILKWSHMSFEHFKFWQTYETQVNNLGNPFAPVTVVDFNVDGGIGIWGDYNSFYDTVIVKKQ